ncbi:glycosyltransferase [Bradyrhizobium sp. WBAH42]|nr:hypothetical protein [Bradyrhizobium sp. WBAH30]MDD1543439.1 hypothetical protein [Bradyrhizobium sp. WBAH41]MDD1557569.1 hypothetical protein [Bradyrhizobium sp. WBAH23]MDD1564981.1 hypothetical protein [Bradyrhizobium sp. WBAH33]MDD1590389.1 hypothetical protein [Bradyrhizobium sp. WBAH42]NRB88096.1 hypothetical protein [Bradyrhizobium sp. WBAH10]QCJ93438.1 hypothetical protein DAA57_37055 [Bradyrhizobium yuanmingense]
MLSRISISIIITNYNYERYVGQAIESALHQTRPADEIIVLDDGSTDGSRRVISSYGDRITPIFQANEGIKSISNTGYGHSNGTLIIYLDADDVLYPNALEHVEKMYSPGVAKIQFDLDVIDQNGSFLGRRYCNFPRPISAAETAAYFERFGTYTWPVTSGNAYSRSFLEEVMPLTPPVSHDGALNTIAPLYGRVETIIEPLGQYRLHNRNISRINDTGQINIVPDFASRIRIRKLEFDMLRDHARRIGKPLPQNDLLDHELVFVNYRIMARKLEHEDGTDADRSLMGLWWKAILVIWHGPYGYGAAIKHLVWVCSLTPLPNRLARLLIHARYSRARPLSNLRKLLSFARLSTSP